MSRRAETFVAIGDIVLTPHGEMKVVEVSLATQMFVAQLGGSGIVMEFREEDLEYLPEPHDFSDRRAIDQWLRCVAKVVPGVEVQSHTVRCDGLCGCHYCYRVERRYPADNHAEVTHMVDSEACECIGCPCARREWTNEPVRG